MSNNCSGSHNHYNPNEPRDDRGRWTSGADLSWAEQRLMHAYPVNTYTHYMLDVSSRQNKARHRSALRPRLRFPAMI